MSAEIEIAPGQTAVLVMDYQMGIVSAEPEMLERGARVIECARRAGIPIFYVVVRFRSGYPEIGSRNRMLSRARESNFLLEGSEGVEVHPRVAPRPEDVVVVKRRIGAFSTTDLDILLRVRDISTLILLGYISSGVVLATATWAADLDYDVVVVEDCCADMDEVVHQTVMDKILPLYGTTISSTELISTLEAGPGSA